MSRNISISNLFFISKLCWLTNGSLKNVIPIVKARQTQQTLINIFDSDGKVRRVQTDRQA